MAENLALREFESRLACAAALADELVQVLHEAVEENGEASLVVSGGTSPVQLFRELSGRKLPWDRVWVIPSDERVVPLSHPDRNESMIRRELLQNRAAAAGLVSLLSAGPLPGSLLGRFDAAVLGMGTDGHTASLFPDSPDLDAALASDKVLYRLDAPRLETSRISLTPHALLRCSQRYLLFFGAEKRRVFDSALASGDVSKYPVNVLLKQAEVPVTVFWAP